MTTEPGLRERKKQQTRLAIADAAQRLFAQRGFDAVTVAEVARAAEVSEGTVFNYFPTKEDLFYARMEVFEEELVDAVRSRPSGKSALEAFRRFMLESAKRLGAEETADTISRAAAIIGASPALQARERELVAAHTDALASLIAEDTGAGKGDVEPWAVANALMGAQRAVRAQVWRDVADGLRGPKLAAKARAQIRKALARLERGLGEYAVKG